MFLKQNEKNQMKITKIEMFLMLCY